MEAKEAQLDAQKFEKTSWWIGESVSSCCPVILKVGLPLSGIKTLLEGQDAPVRIRF